MSTRATYQFPAVTIYIHHDGYEQGAAYYLYNAFMAGGMSAESMIRGNDRAEITSGHHGDTEYHYTISGHNLTVEHRRPGDEWKTIYTGTWFDFVNKHIDPEWLDSDFQPLKLVGLDKFSGKAVHTPETLSALRDETLKTLGRWATNGNAKGANFETLKERLEAIDQHLATFTATPAWKAAA